jgi:hypothetical protein
MALGRRLSWLEPEGGREMVPGRDCVVELVVVVGLVRRRRPEGCRVGARPDIRGGELVDSG